MERSSAVTVNFSFFVVMIIGHKNSFHVFINVNIPSETMAGFNMGNPTFRITCPSAAVLLSSRRLPMPPAHSTWKHFLHFHFILLSFLKPLHAVFVAIVRSTCQSVLQIRLLFLMSSLTATPKHHQIQTYINIFFYVCHEFLHQSPNNC